MERSQERSVQQLFPGSLTRISSGVKKGWGQSAELMWLLYKALSYCKQVLGQVLLLRAALQGFIFQSALVSGIAFAQVPHLALGLIKNLIRFSYAHLLSVSRSLWRVSLPSTVPTVPLSLVSPNIRNQTVHAILVSSSEQKILN